MEDTSKEEPMAEVDQRSLAIAQLNHQLLGNAVLVIDELTGVEISARPTLPTTEVA